MQKGQLVDEKGLHCHQCQRCSTVWQHPEECAGDEDAHACPKCGQMQWYKAYLDQITHIDFPWLGPITKKVTETMSLCCAVADLYFCKLWEVFDDLYRR